ncbi:hypothetical protein [Musicola paradisiaca]|uniref:Uncharacterized protein n=1 Tax=Musicola paradisiaca (strain Ech703) TaxID=579405 RepID=C6C3S5_MUSP7|nr:hypothetical protein [Musicola paradisiaca]ACS85420.1 hypothetical protein Dd703_1623 [Musicola paradisiaca Ech703]
MLASLIRALFTRRRSPRAFPRTDSTENLTCTECEYCLYSHAANPPFDQTDECLHPLQHSTPEAKNHAS